MKQSDNNQVVFIDLYWRQIHPTSQLIRLMGDGESVCELISVQNGLIKIDSRIGACLEGFALQRVLLLQRSIFQLIRSVWIDFGIRTLNPFSNRFNSVRFKTSCSVRFNFREYQVCFMLLPYYYTKFLSIINLVLPHFMYTYKFYTLVF